ncbi:MAG: chemotaxis protein CheX [Acidobacteriia bacterium]|nr:chemotaxis protein CheX [Terriglobia bacterium]
MPPELELSDAGVPAAERVDILRAVSAEVLETMFFTEALDTECEHDWLPGAVWARIAFSGSHCGHMLLGLSGEVATSIASGFLGLDCAETGEQERAQVILELANILCGAVLSRLWPESRLLLDAPEMGGWEGGLDGSLHGCLALPEGMLAVSIRMCAPSEPPDSGRGN